MDQPKSITILENDTCDVTFAHLEVAGEGHHIVGALPVRACREDDLLIRQNSKCTYPLT